MKIVKTAFKIYKNKLPIYLAYSLMIGFIFILVLTLGYFFPLSLVLTIPLIIIPLIYGVELSITHIENNQPYSLSTLLFGYKTYFSLKAFGCYGVIIAFIKGLIAFIATYFITSLITTSIYINIDPTFSSIILEIQNTQTFEDYLEIIKNLAENKSFISASNITTMIALLPAIYLFFHHVLVNSFKAVMSFYAKEGETMSIFRLLFKQTFKYIRKEYYKDYYASYWFIGVLIIIGYLTGALIGYFFIPNISPFQIPVLGLVGVLIVMLFFIPYIFIVMDLLFRKYQMRLYAISMDVVINEMEKYMEQNKLNEEEVKWLNDMKNAKKEYQDHVDKNKTSDNGGK